jgi:hypothetical protein
LAAIPPKDRNNTEAFFTVSVALHVACAALEQETPCSDATLALHMLPFPVMVGVQSLKTETTFLFAPRVFGKLLHLAYFQGWRPEKVSHDWPSETWDTEIILPHLGPYMLGDVSETDARGLLAALRGLHDSEADSLDAEHYAALLTLLALLEDGPVRTLVAPSRVPAKPTS